MYISRQIIANLIDLKDITNSQMVEALNNCGLETEIIHDYQELNRKLKVAVVLTKQKHAFLQKLNVLTVHDGTNELTIICGADNFQENDKVILAPLGTKLNENIIIKKRKFADVYSEGMLCSWAELNLPVQEKKSNEIVILTPESETGSQPLDYFSWNDCLFKIQLPWNQRKSALVYLVAQYLSKSFHLNWKNQNIDEPVKILEKKQIKKNHLVFFETDTNQSISSKTFISTPLWMQNQLLMNEKQNISKNNIWENIAQYVKLETGIKLQVEIIANQNLEKTTTAQSGTQILKNALFSENEKNYSLDFSRFSNNIIHVYPSETEKQNKEKLPFFYSFAAQRYLWWATKIIDQKQIWQIYVSAPCKKIQKKMTLNLSYINKVLGTNFQINDLIKILKNTPLKLKLKAEEITFTLPESQSWTNHNQIISEIIKYYDINQIKSKFILPLSLTYNKNPYILQLNNLNKYLLSLGLKRVKTFVFNDAKNIDKSSIKIQESNKYLQTSLINNLIPLAKRLNKSIFTIDKVFAKKENNFQENLSLGIVWKNPWIKNFILQEKMEINAPFLYQMIWNILKTLDIREGRLFKGLRLIPKNVKSLFINPQTLNLFINSEGKEVIYYNGIKIGQIGIIPHSSNKNNQTSLLFLEMNLSSLMKFKKTTKTFFQIKNQSVKLIFQDFTFQILQPWKEKVYLTTQDEKFLEINYFEYLLEQIENADKTIKKIEIIDLFQNQKCTLRIWKNKNIQDKEKDSFFFFDLEKKLKTLKNVKILEK